MTAVVPRTLFAVVLLFTTARSIVHADGDAWSEVETLHRAGRGEDALARLEAIPVQRDEGRHEAMRGLVLLGLSRGAEARAALRAALAFGGSYVDAHREGITLAVTLVERELGRLRVTTSVVGARLRVGDRTVALPLDEPLWVAVGEVEIEVSAEGHAAATARIVVEPGEITEVRLDPSLDTCPHEAMTRSAATDGQCCWPGQRWVDDRCTGPARCPLPLVLDGEACVETALATEDDSDLDGVQLGVRVEVFDFVRPNTGLFRAGRYGGERGTRPAPRAELRVGYRVARFFAFELAFAGHTQQLHRWYEANAGVGPKEEWWADADGKLFGFDLGLHLQLHTNRTRRAGAVDFVVDVGAHPFGRAIALFALDGQADARMSYVTFPTTVGIDVFLSRRVAFSIHGGITTWLPLEYRSEAYVEDGFGGFQERDYRLGRSELTVETAWSVSGGLRWLL